MALIQNHITAINAATYTPINVPSNMETVSAFTLATADETGFYISYDSGTTETYVPGGSISVKLGQKITVSGTVEICSVKGTTSTNIGGLIG